MSASQKTFKDNALCPEILHQMNEYRKGPENQFCDWVLESYDGISFPVHKLVVASACPFFSALFNTSLSETRHKTMILKNISGKSLERLLEYMYSGEIKITVENMRETFENASYLLLKNLQNFIADYLESSINDDTCLDLWRFAEKNVCENLSRMCINYILKNGDRLLTPWFFYELEFEEIKELLKHDTLKCPEETICERVIKWIERDYKNRKEYVKELLDEVRFPLLSDAFMLSFIYESNLLRKNEIFSLKIHETSKTKLQLSQNHFVLNKSTTSRYGGCDRKIFAVYGKTCSMYTNNELLEKSPLRIEYNKSAKTIFKNNLLFICGGDGDVKSECQYFCPLQNNWKYFPSMKRGRSCHGAVFLRDKIYACGGEETNTVEYFDLCSGKWVDSTSFANKYSNFGICVKDDCIYTICGVSKSIDRFDCREGQWIKIANQTDDFSKAGIYEDCLYCMSKKGGKIFDLRQQKWTDTFIPSFNSNSYEINEFDICIENNIIYLHGCYTYSAYYTDYRRILRSYTIGESTDWTVMKDSQTSNLTSPAICVMFS